jgi:hypothetical protein
MARKKRRSLTGKRKKKSKTARGKKNRPATRTRKLRKRRPRTFGDKVTGAYRAVVDTIKGTDRLRNKMESPASSETE